MSDAVYDRAWKFAKEVYDRYGVSGLLDEYGRIKECSERVSDAYMAAWEKFVSDTAGGNHGG
jgi:hypothetical protein